MKTLVIGLAFVTAAAAASGQSAGQENAPARFDMVVRGDFFAGFGGDQARLQRGMEYCERTLAENPNHAEALVWHGGGLGFQAGVAFQKGDAQQGMALWSRAMTEMDRAVDLEPDNVAVRIPRGAMLLQATRNMAPEVARPLLEKALGDYEKTLELQAPYFSTLGDHPKGELLFGLAEGYSRLGNMEKARAYFERLVADAPGSGQTPKAREWLATGTLTKSTGLGCVGCHK